MKEDSPANANLGDKIHYEFEETLDIDRKEELKMLEQLHDKFVDILKRKDQETIVLKDLLRKGLNCKRLLFPFSIT